MCLNKNILKIKNPHLTKTTSLRRNQHPSDQVMSLCSSADFPSIHQKTPANAALLPPFLLEWYLQPASHSTSAAGHTVLAHMQSEKRGLEGTSGGHLEHPPALRRLLEQVVNTLSGQVLNISQDGDCTTCLDNLLQGLMTLRVKVMFSLYWVGISCFPACACCLFSFCCTHLRRRLHLLYTLPLGNDSQQWAAQKWVSLL